LSPNPGAKGAATLPTILTGCLANFYTLSIDFILDVAFAWMPETVLGVGITSQIACAKARREVLARAPGADRSKGSG